MASVSFYELVRVDRHHVLRGREVIGLRPTFWIGRWSGNQCEILHPKACAIGENYPIREGSNELRAFSVDQSGALERPDRRDVRGRFDEAPSFAGR